MIVTAELRRSWLRRAETIDSKAKALMSDMLLHLGEEHEATDYADNVLNAAEDLTGVLGSPGLDMWTPSRAAMPKEANDG